MLTGTELASDERADNKGRRISGRTSAKLWVAVGLAAIVFMGAWLKYPPKASSAGAPPAALPQVVVSKPLVQDIDTRLGVPWPIRGGFASRTARASRRQRLLEYFSRTGTSCGRATSFSPLILDPTRLRSPRQRHRSMLRRLVWNWLTGNLTVPRI